MFYYGDQPSACGYTGSVTSGSGRQFPATSISAARPAYTYNSAPFVASTPTTFISGETFQQIAISTASNAVGPLAFLVHSAGVRIGPAPTYIPKIVTFTSA